MQHLRSIFSNFVQDSSRESPVRRHNIFIVDTQHLHLQYTTSPTSTHTICTLNVHHLQYLPFRSTPWLLNTVLLGGLMLLLGAILPVNAGPIPRNILSLTTVEAISLTPANFSSPNASTPQLFAKDTEHYCVREALVALADWRFYCDHPVKLAECWTREPGVEACCGKWVASADDMYKNYPRIRDLVEVSVSSGHEWHWVPRETHNDQTRQAILRRSDEYLSTKGKQCGRWEIDNALNHSWFTEHFGQFGKNMRSATGRSSVQT